jgi:hypothetical protein
MIHGGQDHSRVPATRPAWPTQRQPFMRLRGLRLTRTLAFGILNAMDHDFI